MKIKLTIIRTVVRIQCSRNGPNVPYMQYKMFTFIKLQSKVLKPSNLLRGSLRQYSNCIQEKNSQKYSRAPVEGVRCEATKVQFCCSSLLPSSLHERILTRIICQPEVEQNGCQTHSTMDYTESNSHEEVFNDVKAICTL